MPTLRVQNDVAEVSVDFQGGGDVIVLDSTLRLPIRLAGMPRDTPYEVRVCTYGDAGRGEGARLAALHARGWGGRTRCFVVFDAARGWLVLDSGSGIPVRVNGEAVGEHRLRHGDRIEAADGLTFTFCDDAI